jgi:beta-lactamase regulating signal transducer with metallopeptidase domain
MSAILAALINGGIAGAAVTLAVWLTLAIAPRRALNAATRYAVWWTTLLLVVMLPLFYLPRRPERIPVPQFIAPAATQPIAATETEVQPVSQLVSTNERTRMPQFPLELSLGAWPIRIFTLWGIATIFMLLRLCASYVVLERRKRRARAVEKLADWPVRALVSPDIASPMAAGLFRPAILLPERLLAELDDDEIDQIRMHETAHLLRRDDIALLMQRSIEALFALHPVVRWITRRIDLEREIACDDFVVEQTGQARPYASCLTRVVEIAGGVRSSLVAAAATEEHSHLARRIEMLLDKTRHKGTRLLKIRLLLLVGALIALACVVVRTPAVFACAADSFYVQAPVPPEPPEPPAASSAPDAPEAPLPPAPAAPAAVPEPPAPPAPPLPQSSS